LEIFIDSEKINRFKIIKNNYSIKLINL
jgi:hypothetical protein